MTDHADPQPHRTDFGAPIIAGPFETLEAARAAQADAEDGVGVYYELADDKWYVHGSTDGSDDTPPLTTYN